MLDPVTLDGQNVRLEPLSLDHISNLVQAANGPRDTFSLTDVPTDSADMLRYVRVFRLLDKF